MQNIHVADLATLTQKDSLILLAHDGRIDSKISKAFERLAEEITSATLDFSAEPDALNALEINASSPTLLVFEHGEEIGRYFRPKAKIVYDYADYFAGNAPKPADKTAEDSPSIGKQNAKPIQVTKKNFKSVVLKSKQPVLVDLWAPWCGPCLALAPALESLAEEWGEQARVAKINIDENRDLQKHFGVQSIPTMVIVKNGKEVDRLVGAMPAGAIRQRMEKWL